MYHTFLILGLGTGELILIALLVLLLFGAKKFPEMMKGLGKGIKTFKEEMSTKNVETEETAGPSEKKAGKISEDSEKEA